MVEYSRIVDVIVAIESRFPVERWTIGGVHVWPLIRIRLYSALTDERGPDSEARPPLVPQTGAARRPGRSAIRRLATQVMSLARRPWTAMRARRVEHRLASSCEALFYSLTHMRAKVDGAWYDRHCDPLIDILRAENGSRFPLLESAYELSHRRPRAHEEDVVEIDQWLAHSTSTAKPTFTSRERELAAFDDFLAVLRAELPGINADAISPTSIEGDVAALISLRDAFERVLSRAKPRVCFVVCYYHIPAMALIWACRRLGIRSVDLQHGMQAGPPYARWTKVPPGGYETLPDFFWTWNASDAAGIREWANHSDGHHRAIVGGYPWLDRFLEVRSSTGKNAKSTARPGAERPIRILFSMPTFSYALPPWVVAAIRSSPREWEWWFRLHPRQLQARSSLEATLRDDGARVSFEIDAATERPLPVVLQEVDVHMTHSSAVTIEAEYFGVRTVAISPDTARSFANQTSTGVLVVATDPTALVQAIRRQAEFPVGRPTDGGGREKGRLTREALTALVAKRA